MAIAPQPGPPAVESTAVLPDPAYADLLWLEDLLAAVRTDGDPSMSVFIVPHQGCELMFKLMQQLLDHAAMAFTARDSRAAADWVRPLPAVMAVVEQHFEVLRKLSVDQFEAVRTRLGTASGIQSAQWRRIEYTCGLRDRRHLYTGGFTDRERATLLRQLDEPSVADLFYEFAADLGTTPEHGPRVGQIRADLLAFDEAVGRWRYAHVKIAKHFLGERPGTAGSSGVAYLLDAAARRLFPALDRPTAAPLEAT